MNPTIRALVREDLAAVTAIDAAIQGRPRGAYVARRLAAALREPAVHVQLAAVHEGQLVGYMLARVLGGEFGRNEPALRLELLGVRAQDRHRGVAQQLYLALVSWAGRHGVHEVRTAADWRDEGMLHWMAHVGFELAPNWVLQRRVGDALSRRDGDAALDEVSLPQGEGPGHEVDYGRAEDNDFERHQRGHPQVRNMDEADLREIVRIDRGITGTDRSGYIGGRMQEALADSGVRVSLTARLDGAVVGFLMARADLGDFGRAEPVAVLDTLGVAGDHARHGVGRALLRELDASLDALHIEQVETVVAVADLALAGFFLRAGFAPSQRLAFAHRLAAAGAASRSQGVSPG